MHYYDGLHRDDRVYWFKNEYSISSDAKTASTSKKGDKYSGGENVIITTTYADSVNVRATIRVQPEDMKGSRDDRYISFSTGVTWKREKMEFEFVRHEYLSESGKELLGETSSFNVPVRYDNSKALAVLGDKLYFTVLTTKEHSGQNGIFEVEEYGVWWGFGKPSNIGKVRTLTTFSLDDQDVEVVALEAVNNKLVLVLYVNDVLTLRLFDTTGKFMDEISYPDFERREYYGQYSSYVNGEILNLCFSHGGDGYAQQDSVISISVGERITARHKLDKLDLKNENASHFIVSAKVQR